MYLWQLKNETGVPLRTLRHHAVRGILKGYRDKSRPKLWKVDRDAVAEYKIWLANRRRWGA